MTSLPPHDLTFKKKKSTQHLEVGLTPLSFSIPMPLVTVAATLCYSDHGEKLQKTLRGSQGLNIESPAVFRDTLLSPALEH